jgi:hypothetical protein
MPHHLRKRTSRRQCLECRAEPSEKGAKVCACGGEIAPVSVWIDGRAVNLPLLDRLHVQTGTGTNAWDRLRKAARSFGLRIERDPVASHPGPDGANLPTYEVYGREDRVEAFRLTSEYAGRCEFALADVNVLGERSSTIRPKDHGRHLAPKSSRAPVRDAHTGGQHANRRYYVLSLDGEIVMGPYFAPPLVPPGFEVLPTGDDPPVGTAPWSKRQRHKTSPPIGWRGNEIVGGAGPFPEYLTYGGEHEGPNPNGQ